jgi:protoporphyrinogen oxidase
MTLHARSSSSPVAGNSSSSRTREHAPPSSALVVGAGISGLSAALLLAREGVDVELWEAGDEPGGILEPVEFQGLDCDRGSHRVHPESHPLLRELTSEEDWESRDRNGKLVLNGRHIPYPIDPISFLRGLGWEAAVDMGLGWLTRPRVFERFLNWEDARQETADDDKGFENFVVERVGESAYRRFYRPYVEKVWGEDPDDISQSVAKQRVSTSNPVETILKSIGFQDDETFLYPRSGMAGLAERLLDKAREAGVDVEYGRYYDPARDGTSDSGAPADHDVVFYSGYLPDLVDDTELDHRGLYLLHLAVPEERVDETIDTWYVPEPDYWFGRVSQPENFSPELSREGRSVLCVEIPEGRWGRDRDFLEELETVVDQLVAADILDEPVDPVDARQTFVPRVYPHFFRNWYDAWRSTLESVRDMGDVVPIGRQGLFLHCNMDHCVSISADAVEHVMSNEPVETWFDQCPDYLDLRVRD